MESNKMGKKGAEGRAPKNNTNIEYCTMENSGVKIQFMI
jgi:hypothetical protein